MNTPQVDVSIVIVSFNNADLLRSCLWSVMMTRAWRQRTHEVIVIDNASTDGSPKMVQAEFPRVRLFVNRENLGFARAVNRGLRAARGRHALLLNSDCQVTPDAIGMLLNFMERTPEAGIVSPGLQYPDGSPQPVGGRTPTLAEIVRLATGAHVAAPVRLIDDRGEEVREVEQTSGACMMVRRQAWEQCGLLDEAFFLYWEDIDWCRRLRAEGWRVFVFRPAVVRHVHGGSSGDWRVVTHPASLLSVLHYTRKHHGLVAAGMLWGLLLVREAVHVTLNRLRPRDDAAARRLGLRALLGLGG